MLSTKRRRSLGSFYTPDWIAEWMVSRAMSGEAEAAGDWRILDPACGDGAFVLPVLDWLARQKQIEPGDVTGRLAIVRDHVFGVDADSTAIEKLHLRVADWIGDGSEHVREVADVLAQQFLCGDSLLGEDWSVGPEYSVLSTQYSGPTASDGIGTEIEAGPLAIDWAAAFPSIAQAGGFDLVIGNPPYRRELNAKSDFDRIAASSIGQKWRAARMDLWHYFVHRSLDLLKPGGRLAFIVNSYWTSAASARSLRERLSAETTLEEIACFGAAPLFPNVSGRHMIFRVRKGIDSSTTCRVFDLSSQSRSQIEETLKDGAPDVSVDVPQAEMWFNGQLRTVFTVSGPEMKSDGVLSDLFDVRQGIAENPPFVTRAAAAEFGDPALIGHGVFVLTNDEVAKLELDKHEAALLRPYYSLPTIGRFRVADEPSHQLLYLTKSTAPQLELLPRIAAHLERYRAILERRREVQSGKIAWWHLHWPREERLFTEPRVICVQMAPEPRFAYVERPTYVGFSLNVIVANRLAAASISLAALTAILNSSRAKQWFEAHAKPRGVHLDISGTVLKRFPLPINTSPQVLAELDQLARTWPAADDQRAIAEQRLDQLTEDLYSD